MNMKQSINKKNTIQPDDNHAGSSAGGDGDMHDQKRGKSDWIGEQFKRVYDTAADEPLPKDMQDLLDAIDDLDEGSFGGKSRRMLNDK